LSSSTTTKALLSTEWIAEHGKDKGLRIVEVDVDPSAYDKGHIEGAVGWNWRRDLQDQVNRDIASKEALANLLGRSGITPDTNIALYGDNNNWFAAYAYWALKYYGHDKVQLIDGGRVKWEKEGREYSTDVPTYNTTEYHFHGSPKEDIRAYRDHVNSKLGKAGLVDVRSPKEYSGELLAPENLPQAGEPSPGRGAAGRSHPDRSQHPLGHRGQRRGRQLQDCRRAEGDLRRQGHHVQQRGHRLLPYRRTLRSHVVRFERAARLSRRPQLRRLVD